MEPRAGKGLRLGELEVYYGLVAAYFFAFGLQFVLYPSLITFSLGKGGAQLGAAQFAISLPMFALLLLTGVYAERAQAGPSLFRFQLLMAAPPLLLAAITAMNALSYHVLLGYGVLAGTVMSFILPVRDAALNGVITRELQAGRKVSLTTAATVITAVQIGSQIGGILLAQYAEHIGPAPLLTVQGAVCIAGAFLALRLRAPAPSAPRRKMRDLWNDLTGGVRYALGDPVIGAMLFSGLYAGVFILGSGQVLFPLIVRDSYAGGPSELALLYAGFWAACFVSAAFLSRIGGLARPGRALILAHAASAAALASFAFAMPLWALYLVVAGWGIVSGVAITTNRMITQALTKQDYLARVMALYSMGFMGGAPIGAMLAGVSADLWGPHRAALAPALGLALCSAAIAAFSPIWRLERPDGEAV